MPSPNSNAPEDVFGLIEMGPDTECWRWLGGYGGRPTDPRPYFQADGRRTLAYRVVYELVHGVRLARDQLVLHSCDRGGAPIGCCNPAHLRIGTPADNNTDKTYRNRAGLNTTMVAGVKRLLLRDDMTHADIAELYGIARSTVSMIATGARHTYGEHEVQQMVRGGPITRHRPEHW